MRPNAREQPGSLDLDAEWIERIDDDPVERMTAASVKIRVGEIVATEVEDVIARTVRDHVRVSANLFASWLAGNWWRLRWEPQSDSLGWQMTHCTAAIGFGYSWPNLTFDSDGESIRVVGRPTTRFGTVRYLTNLEEVVPATIFENAIDRLLETVTQRLCAVGCSDAPLVQLWREVLEERHDTAATNYRRLEAMAGFDPDEAPEEVIEEALALSSDVGGAAMRELAAASGGELAAAAEQALAAVESASAHVSFQKGIVQRFEEDVRPIAGERPWVLGYRTAESYRRKLGVGARPLRDHAFAAVFGLDEAILLSASVEKTPIGVAVRDDASPDDLRVVLARRHPHARRFELARMLGDHVGRYSVGDKLLPVTRSRTARQKAQRAFAAEFLCPIAGLRERFDDRTPDEDDIQSAADDYGVSEQVVVDQWRNRGPDAERSGGQRW